MYASTPWTAAARQCGAVLRRVLFANRFSRRDKTKDLWFGLVAGDWLLAHHHASPLHLPEWNDDDDDDDDD
eukprot:COSAG02_NODE_8419_length_2578_cov_1.135135_2_plen_71_part_00